MSESVGRRTPLKDMLDRVYGAPDAATLAAAYDEWARDYDADLVEGLGWDAPVRTVEYLVRHLIPSAAARVLDAGAGTGLVGEALAAHGFGEIDALDLSSGMLEVCRAKGIYAALHEGQLGQPLGLPSDHYDAVVAVGVLTAGHAGPDCFEELTRVVRPGGRIAFALRPDLRESMGFADAQLAQVAAGAWRLLEQSPDLCGFRDLQTKPYQVWVYEVLR